MSNVIGFLERMGQDAAFRHATHSDVELALLHAQVDPELQAAILDKDQAWIEALLGAQANVCCVLETPKHDEDEEEQEPSKEEDEISAQTTVRSIAAAA